MKLLAIDPQGACLDYLMRCQQDGHEVRWFIPETEKTKYIGRGLVPVVRDYKEWMRWADMVILADNTKYLREMDSWRKEGIPMVGASAMAADWELDREIGQNVFKKHGIPTIPYKIFNDYDKAIAYVKKEDRRFVSKPSGDADKALSYVSKSPEDMVYMLERWKKLGKLKSPFILQEFIPGIEMAVGGWFGPGGFNTGWCENWEFKKLMNDDLGCATGEQGCFSFDTQVLTSLGWREWPDVTKEDELATLVDGELKFEKPSEVVSFDVDGPMISWKNQSIDILVTPNHNMYVNSQFDARKNINNYKFVSAEKCNDSQYSLLRTAEWKSNSPEYFIIPGRENNGKKQRSYPSIKIPFGDWCAFLGIYMAEGSSSNTQVNIAQSHPEKCKKVHDILKILPFKVVRFNNGFRISNKELAKMLNSFGKSYEKWIPDYILNADPKDILRFLDAYAVGDAHTQTNGSREFYTSNLRLADDLQNIMLRVGRVGIIKKLKRKKNCGYINGRQIIQRRDAFIVYERTKKTRAWLDKRDKRIVDYKGKVYCATVSSHILFVRRNGKPVWCGNTVMRYVRESKLANKVLAPLADALEKLNYIGYVDVNCIIDEKGTPWPLEFTMRFGYPCFFIQQALHKGDSAEWLMDLIQGKDAGNLILNQIATGVVMSIPDYPYSHLTRKEVVGVPLYAPKALMPQIHPCEMMLGEAPHKIGGRIITMPCLVTAGDYVLVTTGTGSSVSQSLQESYRVIKKLKMPNSPMYRTDIGRRLKKQLPELQRLGYARNMQYQ